MDIIMVCVNKSHGCMGWFTRTHARKSTVHMTPCRDHRW